MRRSAMIELLVLLVMYLGFSGCIGYKTFPLAARSGDTISLALGGTFQHETVPGDEITLNDLTITIKQDIDGNGTIEPGEVFPVKKRYLFRLYPDPTSEVANYTAVFNNTFVGQWSIVLDLVDPNNNDTPLNLAENMQAKVVVTSTKLMSTFYYPFEGVLAEGIPITILPGTGQSHNFNNVMSQMDMKNLQPLPQLNISFAGSGSVAAVSLEIDFDETAFKPDSILKIKQDVSRTDTILTQRVFSDNGNRKMRILLMTNQGALQPSELKCFIIWNKAAIAAGQTVTAGDFTVTSAKFYNESGAEVAGLGINNVVAALQYQQQP